MRKILCPMIFVCALIVGCVSADISETDRWNFVHNKFIKEPEATLMGWVNRNYNGVGLSMMVVPCWNGPRENLVSYFVGRLKKALF